MRWQIVAGAIQRKGVEIRALTLEYENAESGHGDSEKGRGCAVRVAADHAHRYDTSRRHGLGLTIDSLPLQSQAERRLAVRRRYASL